MPSSPNPMPSGLIRLALIFSCLVLLFTGPVSALDLEGRIQLLEKGKVNKEVRFAVVYFEPAEKVPVTPAAEPFAIAMSRKAFIPRVTAVPVGSRVMFPNDDRILHNVFSLSPGNRFDLGLYRRGESKDALFEKPGIVQVFCNVHHSMVAYILVLDTPFMTQPSPDGRFSLSGLPDGPGTLRVWHERAAPLAHQMTLPVAGEIELEMNVTKPRIPPHRNKFGKPYKRTRRGKAY